MLRAGAAAPRIRDVTVMSDLLMWRTVVLVVLFATVALIAVAAAVRERR
jgi:hypothetical protein